MRRTLINILQQVDMGHHLVEQYLPWYVSQLLLRPACISAAAAVDACAARIAVKRYRRARSYLDLRLNSNAMALRAAFPVSEERALLERFIDNVFGRRFGWPAAR